VRFVALMFRNNPSSPWIIVDKVDSLMLVSTRGRPDEFSSPEAARP
jgi:hypothetical protein